MGFFQKLFGKSEPAPTPVNKKAALSPEQFIATATVQELLLRFKKETVLLRPHRSGQPLSVDISKFGGKPNMNGLAGYPCCDRCDSPLNFVVQLYRADFSELYFPEGKDLFQLFRCPNGACPAAYSEPFHADHKMFLYYFVNNGKPGTETEIPFVTAEDAEEPVPDCMLKPIQTADYPNYEDWDDELTRLQATYGKALSDYFSDEFVPAQRTKIGGWPSFTQAPHYPECTCGKPKDFFFQLSSEDPEEGITNAAPGEWSPHNIMIGDVGNIYFYVCRSCGESSIESYWDCC